MRRIRYGSIVLGILVCSSSQAQQLRDSPFKTEPQIVITPALPASPYVGFETREVKTMPPERQEGLRRGASLGYGLAAELNGYPSPVQVVELADQLGLDAEQKTRVRAIADKLRKDAIAAGEALLAAEAHIDRLFQLKQVSPDRIEAQTAVAAGQEARLRAIHLNAHLATRELLNPEQIESYQRLKVYVREDKAKP